MHSEGVERILDSRHEGAASTSRVEWEGVPSGPQQQTPSLLDTVETWMTEVLPP